MALKAYQVMYLLKLDICSFVYFRFDICSFVYFRFQFEYSVFVQLGNYMEYYAALIFLNNV